MTTPTIAELTAKFDEGYRPFVRCPECRLMVCSVTAGMGGLLDIACARCKRRFTAADLLLLSPDAARAAGWAFADAEPRLT